MRNFKFPRPLFVYYLWVYRLIKITGHLPNEGGLLNQDRKLLDAIIEIDSVISEHSEKEMKKSTKEHKASASPSSSNFAGRSRL